VLGWTLPPFELPAEILADWRSLAPKGAAAHAAWAERLAADAQGQEFARRMAGELPSLEEAEATFAAWLDGNQKVATRKASELALDVLAPLVPELVGGSADLTGSNLTKVKATTPLTADDYSGRYVYYGIREFGMAAAMNGMALHGGIIPMAAPSWCSPTICAMPSACRRCSRLASSTC
jgi:transketolase